MLPACNRGAGANIHTPDVCLTPPVPVPVPYVNTAFNVTAVAFVPHVFVAGLNAHNLGTILASSTGDEPGVAHWTIMGFSKYVVGNPIVNVGMLPGENLTCASIGNSGNAASGMCAVPSAVNVFYTSRESPALARSNDELAALLPLCGDDAQRMVGVERTDAGELRLAISRIGPAVPLLVRRALRAFGGDPRRVVLDLRGNPGGDLEAGVRLAELFLPRNAVVAHQVFGDGSERTLRTRLPPAYEGALTVLVDGATASAAEVVAAALKAHGRAEVAGERTHGKGSAQAFTPHGLDTVAFLLDPNGAPIDGRGIAPTEARGAET